MAEIVNISYIGSGTELQTYIPSDDALITNSFIYTQFGDPNDSIEYFIYDSVGNLLDKVYNAIDYKPDSTVNPTTELYSSIALDPKKDLESRGYNRGTLEIQYNFLRNLFNSAYGSFYWIKEISPSRTEIKLASQNISNNDILSGFNQYQAYVAGLNYYNDFYLNFGDNQHIIAVNVAYTEDESGAYLLIKLYEPLPSDFDVKDQLWISEKIAESSRYNVTIDIEADTTSLQNSLRGPNFDIKVSQQVAQTTPYYSYQSLSSTSVSGSFQKMMSYYQDKALEINVDYTDFSNFVHFSSITSRIQNFAQKISNIESYTSASNSQLLISGGLSNPVVSSSYVILQKQIDDIITNFDTYEYYLYFSSGSYTWPKSGSTQPYTLYSSTSPQVTTWLTSSLLSASYYDSTNKDLLTNVIPQYIQDDSANAPYISFVNMIGQHFDNIWIYYKDVTNRFNATNNPETGISPDLVADALMALGSTLYTNSNISDNLYYSLFGINADGSLLPPTGSEKITSYVTSSLTTLSPKAIQSEIYKRIYHNIPYLYKTKGTRNSIDAIVNIFGIPKSILTINEFGGYDRSLITGVDSIYNTKISGSTSVAEISSSLLHPEVTLQYYSTQERLNSKNLEFGFSPADSINSTISSSVGYINIDQLIGDPGAQYSASYPGLVAYQNSFFTGSQVHDIYEYIRLLKYYDNSIFKMVKDYVPARSSLSTGMIVKSHVLERNKYERHEPEMDNSMNYSQSVETVTISGTDAPEIQYSTAYNSKSQYTVVSPYIATGSNNVYGPVSMSNTYAWEKYTGEFGGSEIEMVTDEFSQLERSSITFPWTSSVASTQSMFTFYNEGALVNNFTQTQLSKEFVSAEYSYGIDTPINFANIVSQSSCQGCGRIPCFTYIIENNGADGAFTYQNCDDINVAVVVPSSGSLSVCAKYNTIYNNTLTNYTASLVDVCGYAYSNSKKYEACYSASVEIGASATVNLDYINCTGSLITNAFSGGPTGTTYGLGCIKKDSIKLSTFTVSTDYTASYFGACDLYSDGCRNIIAFNFAASPSTIISASYTSCNGIAYTSSISGGDYANFGCIKYSTLNTGSFLTFSLTDSGSCVDAKKCTYIPLVTFGPGEYSLNYLRCSGENILITGSVVPMAVAVYLDDCIRYDSVISYNTGITTGGECGFYEDINQYTGSRQYAEIQDYNYHRTSAVHSKYAGGKYTNQNSSENWTFGATYEPRDYYVDYTGLFTEIQSSSYYPDQMVMKVPYLANISGGLQELNSQNNNWVYFQNIYKAGGNVTIKQFNSTQYSNQKYLDKTFKIVESGYSHEPYWYRNPSDTVECYNIPLEGDGGVSSSYARDSKRIDLVAGYTQPDSRLYYDGVSFPDSTSDLCAFPIIYSGSSPFPGPSVKTWYNVNLYLPNRATNTNLGSDPNNRLTAFGSGSIHNFITGSYYTAPSTGMYYMDAAIRLKVNNTYSSGFPMSSDGETKIKIQFLKNASYSTGYLEGTLLGEKTFDIVNSGSFYAAGEFTSICYFPIPYPISLSATDTVYVKVSFYSKIDSGIKVSAYQYQQVFRKIPIDGLYCINPSSNSLISSSFTAGSDTLSINPGMQDFFNANSTFIPQSSSLYNQFGEVSYPTLIQKNDEMIFYYQGSDIGYGSLTNIYPVRLLITDVTTNSFGNVTSIQVYPNLPDYLTSTNINSYKKLVINKVIPDETTMILQGKKNAGKTSYGFAIPENINPQITKNINTLQSTIQSQILNF